MVAVPCQAWRSMEYGRILMRHVGGTRGVWAQLLAVGALSREVHDAFRS
jgi:hypothetical protein